LSPFFARGAFGTAGSFWVPRGGVNWAENDNIALKLEIRLKKSDAGDKENSFIVQCAYGF
jgi:hypothetical protein